ncbi:MAG: competence/damage-inducible protein A [Armatimonadota bacterium]|nr:competence/damage-inducible protein A [Armatimonadota bacterium]MDW8026125.1 competence/damage-inducible protein A [Armatimonadota bacterium]
MQRTAELFAIGSELLLGDVLDTNTNYLCKQLTGLGARVCRAVMLPDDVNVIADELRSAAARKRTLLITTGGLGPTEDDQTLKAVAIAFGSELVLNEEAYRMVHERYSQLASEGLVESAEMTEPRKKMAMLPEGAVPIFNPVGTAPAVWLEWQPEHVVLCLPGVPGELKGIWENTLPPLLQRLLGKAYFKLVEVIADLCDESKLAPIVSEASSAHPKVYIKSRASRFGRDVKLKITLSVSSDNREEVDAELNSAVAHIVRLLKENGIKAQVHE